MKRLRRFNESKEEMDYDYIYQCFVELIDDERAEIQKLLDNFHIIPGKEYTVVNVKTKVYPDQQHFKKFNDVFEYETEIIEKSPFLNHIEIFKYNNEIMQEVEVALSRLSDKYPNYRIQVGVAANSIHINIFPGE
jgi:hypothetical protein